MNRCAADVITRGARGSVCPMDVSQQMVTWAITDVPRETSRGWDRLRFMQPIRRRDADAQCRRLKVADPDL